MKAPFLCALSPLYCGIFIAAAIIGDAWAEDIAGGTFDVTNNSPARRALKQQMAINGVQVSVAQSEATCNKYQCEFEEEFHYEFSFHQGLTCEDWTNKPFNAMTGYSRVHVFDQNGDSIRRYGHASGRTYDEYIRQADFFFTDPSSAANFIARCNVWPKRSGSDGSDGALKLTATMDGLGNIRLDVVNSSKTTSMELDSYSITSCIGIIECGANTFAMVIPPGMTKNVTSITRGNTDANGNQPAMSFTYCWSYRALGGAGNSSKLLQSCGTASSPSGGPMTSQGELGPTPAQPVPQISNPNDPTTDQSWRNPQFRSTQPENRGNAQVGQTRTTATPAPAVRAAAPIPNGVLSSAARASEPGVPARMHDLSGVVSGKQPCSTDDCVATQDQLIGNREAVIAAMCHAWDPASHRLVKPGGLAVNAVCDQRIFKGGGACFLQIERATCVVDGR
jgi:hypothetical protein